MLRVSTSAVNQPTRQMKAITKRRRSAMDREDQIEAGQLSMKENRFLKIRHLLAVVLMAAAVFSVIGVGYTSVTKGGQSAGDQGQ